MFQQVEQNGILELLNNGFLPETTGGELERTGSLVGPVHTDGVGGGLTPRLV